MRTFGEEKKYFEFALEGDDKVYKIPLAQYIPMASVLMMREADKRDDSLIGQTNLLRRYMGDVVDEISSSMVANIINAWVDASADAGASPGES